MAEKTDKKEYKKDNHHHSSKGEISFGLEVLLFIIAIFIIWIFMGGAKQPTDQKPFINPPANQVVPDINN